MINWKKTLVTTLKVIGVFFTVGVIAFFGFRNMLLQRAIQKAQTKLQSEFQSNFQVTEASFVGIAGVRLTGMSLVPLHADTLFQNRISRGKYQFLVCLTRRDQVA